MNVLEILGSKNEWMSEGRLRELAQAQAHLLPKLLEKLVVRGLADCQVADGDVAYRLTDAGRTQLNQPRISTFPPPSWRPTS